MGGFEITGSRAFKNTLRWGAAGGGGSRAGAKWTPIATGTVTCALLHSSCGVSHCSPEISAIPTGCLSVLCLATPSQALSGCWECPGGQRARSPASWEGDSFPRPVGATGVTEVQVRSQSREPFHCGDAAGGSSLQAVSNTPHKIGGWVVGTRPPGVGSPLQPEGRRRSKYLRGTCL